MAVTLKGQTAVYEGTSTDTKPTDADNNAIFKELDTGIRYYYDGTNWNVIPSSGGGGGGGTGTDDYTDLNNKPKVNSVTVVGNLTSSDLKLQGEITNSHKLSADLVDDSTSTNKFNVQADWDQTTNSAPDYIKNKPTLGTAAAKNATDTYNATGTDVTTGKAVAEALATLPEPMVFQGSLGTGGTITTLPAASSSNKGYTYKVITAGTYASQFAKVGDTFISDGSAWVLIPSGDEPSGTVTNVAVANGGGLTVSGSPITSSGTITVGHSNSVTAETSSSVKKFTYDAYGHVTGSSELSTAESNALASGIDSTKVAQIETNKNNILLLEQMDGAKNKFNYEAWKNCGVLNGTKTINGNSFTIVANADDCFSWYENGTPRPYPINARIPCNAGDKVVFTWDYTPLSGQTNDRVGIFANGLSSTGFFALALASNKKIEFTAPTGTTYFSIRFGVQVAGNSAIYGNIQIQSKASYDAGFTDYQPYALSNAELTAAIQAIQAQLANQ